MKAKKKRSRKAVDSVGTDAGERFDEILRMIEQDIVVGRIKPGERVDERALAMRFGTSRTPMREVLVKMASLGIIELRRNKGAFVTELASDRLIGMLEVLAELKVLAAKQSTRRMTIEERQHIAKIRDEMAACVKNRELQNYFEKALALHDAICAGAHNDFLLENTRKIQVCLCAYRHHLSRILHLPIQTSFEENSNVVDAIVRGDSAEAERWMREQTDLRKDEFADLIILISRNSGGGPRGARDPAGQPQDSSTTYLA